MSEQQLIVKAFKTFEEIRKDHPETIAALNKMLEENPDVKDQLFLFQNQNLFVIDPSKIEKSTTEGEIIFKHTRGGFPVKDTNEDIDQELLVYINSTPELLSLLWDIGLLPEQTMNVPHLWLRTVVVTKLFQWVKELEVAIGKGEEGSAYSFGFADGEREGRLTQLQIQLSKPKDQPKSCWVDLNKQIPLEESNYEFLQPDGSILRLEGVTFKSKTTVPISE